jgi:polyisoprenoid-binding protein YceI
MRKFILITVLPVFVASSVVAADVYVFDKVHSTLGFQVRHLFSKVPGKFTDFSGQIQFDETNPEQSSVEVTINAASINTSTISEMNTLDRLISLMCKNFRRSRSRANRSKKRVPIQLM